jgi:uncharacterized membrane protein
MRSIFEAIAGVACHGLDSRSLVVGGSVLPFCGRCTGLYIGIAVTVLALAAWGRLWNHRLPSRRALAVFAVPWAMSGAAWILEFGGVDVAGNAGRAALGFASGVSATIILAPMWAAVVRPHGVESRRSVVAAVGLTVMAAAVASAAAPTVPPAIRYGCASGATAAGFALFAGALNALVISAIASRAHRWMRIRHALVPACAAVMEIAGMSLAWTYLHGL